VFVWKKAFLNCIFVKNRTNIEHYALFIIQITCFAAQFSIFIFGKKGNLEITENVFAKNEVFRKSTKRFFD
jgi:hypothetical protein